MKAEDADDARDGQELERAVAARILAFLLCSVLMDVGSCEWVPGGCEDSHGTAERRWSNTADGSRGQRAWSGGKVCVSVHSVAVARGAGSAWAHPATSAPFDCSTQLRQEHVPHWPSFRRDPVAATDELLEETFAELLGVTGMYHA